MRGRQDGCYIVNADVEDVGRCRTVSKKVDAEQDVGRRRGWQRANESLILTV